MPVSWTWKRCAHPEVNERTLDLPDATPSVAGAMSAADKAKLDAVPVAGTYPSWIKITKTYSDLAAASTTNNIEVYSLPASSVIHNVVVKHTVAFAGGGISAYTVSVGITSTLDKYALAFNVFQAVAATTLALALLPGMENIGGSATSIRLAATSTSANLNAATQGSVDVWLLVSTLPS